MWNTSPTIKRDSRRALFRSRPRSNPAFVVGMLALIGAILLVAFTQTDRLRLVALDTVGLAPTATPFASDYATQGDILYRSGQVEAAEAAFATAIALRPDNVDYLYEYGQILIDLVDLDVRGAGALAEARAIGQRITEMDPADPRGYALQARAQMWTDPNTAIPIALSGLDADPEFAPLHAVLAVAYTNIGRYAEALTRGRYAVELDPSDANAHRGYSIPLIYTGRYNEAIEQLEKAVLINPNLTAPYFELAAQYRRLDTEQTNLEEIALGVYQRILEIDPMNERAYLRICETYAAIGQFQEAQQYCEFALEINPTYAQAYRETGRMQYNRRNYEGAIDSFRECVRLGSEEVECYYLRGLAHYFLGQCDQAWAVLQEALNYADEGPITDTIYIGLENVTIRCAGYQNQALPSPPPPTMIPPTPIGGT
jgi:tetratricopeptide (TPR) repeat protein